MEELFTQSIDLSHATTNSLTFDVAYAIYYSNFNTILDVAVSTDCGLNFSSVYHKTGNALATVMLPASSASDYPFTCRKGRLATITIE